MPLRQYNQLILVGLAITYFVGSGADTYAQGSRPPKRARPPRWSADVRDVFFDDALAELEGERPDYGATVDGANSRQSRGLPGGEDGGGHSSGAAWSKLIDADAIETEIKRLAQSVEAEVTTPGEFKGGAFKACRRDFSLLAVLFAVAAEYDGPVRWQEVAASLRDEFARAGRNCRVGTDATYQEAVRRKQGLADLVSGTRPQVPPAERTVDAWPEVADRPSLMQRLNIAQQERLTKWLANEQEFETHADEVRHEAQVMAMLADVIAREGFDYWDDEQFAAYAKELQQAATEMAAAAELGNFEQAQQAVGRATKACADCHEGYRG